MSRTHSTRARGQLYLDFVVGVGIFVLATAFVVSFAPGLFTSFADDPSQPLVADRAADRVVGPLLGDDSPSGLNATCVSEFFGESGTDCGIDHDEPISERVGIGADYRANVSLVRPVANASQREQLCLDGDRVVACGDDRRVARLGPATPNHGSTVSTTYRTVYVTNRDATLVVRVW